MSEQHIVRITTDDTKKTYEFIDGKPAQTTPQLWRLQINFDAYETSGHFIHKNYHNGTAVIVLERQTLVDIGRLPVGHGDVVPPQPPTETLEDLVLRLLDMVGVRPQE